MSDRNMPDRERVHRAIDRNIARSGYHIYSVAHDDLQRYIYTIGLSRLLGVELVFVGGLCYMKDDALRIIEGVRKWLATNGFKEGNWFYVDALGSFAAQIVHEKWVAELMGGALDYYKVSKLDALQIVPDMDHWTIDVPDMRTPWEAQKEPIWARLREPWRCTVSRSLPVATNLNALRGGRVDEVARWSDDEWEMFAGDSSEVSVDDMRVVSMGFIVASDPSLVAAMDLEVGKGLRRDETDDEWQAWGHGEAGSESDED